VPREASAVTDLDAANVTEAQVGICQPFRASQDFAGEGTAGCPRKPAVSSIERAALDSAGDFFEKRGLQLPDRKVP
jgi:hypothetical protein